MDNCRDITFVFLINVLEKNRIIRSFLNPQNNVLGTKCNGPPLFFLI